MSTAPRSVRPFVASRRASRPRSSASDGGGLLRIGRKVCIVLLAVVAILHLHARLPRPALPPAVAAAIVRLFMQEAEEGRMTELAAMLEELLPGRFAALEAEREAAVARNSAGRDSVPAVTWRAVAETAPDPVRPAALNLAAMHEQAGRNGRTIARLRETVGFDHWRTTCAAGMSEPGLAARAALWRADYGLRQAAFDLARELYETGFALWRDACVVVPELASDPFAASELAGHEARYREVLAALDGGTAAESGAAVAL